MFISLFVLVCTRGRSRCVVGGGECALAAGARARARRAARARAALAGHGSLSQRARVTPPRRAGLRRRRRCSAGERRGNWAPLRGPPPRRTRARGARADAARTRARALVRARPAARHRRSTRMLTYVLTAVAPLILYSIFLI